MPALVLVALLGFEAHPAAAHLGSTKQIEVRLTPEGAEARILLDPVDVAMELGLPPESSARLLLGREDAIFEWVREGIHMEADRPCAAVPREASVGERERRPVLVLALDFRCGGEPARHLADRLVFPDDRQHEALVRVEDGLDVRGHVLRFGRQRVDLGAPASLLDVVLAFGWEGVLHFATGYDHVLFLLSLILSVGLALRARGARSAFRDLVFLVTAFTLGHSITLIAAALQWVVLPSRPVEALIGASIVVVALHNVIWPKERASIPILAGVFGLIHGFGFSSVLSELGLPPARAVAALLSFNVGIEIAQLAFVALVVPLIALASRSPGYERWVVRGGSLFIAGLGALWVVERLASP